MHEVNKFKQLAREENEVKQIHFFPRSFANDIAIVEFEKAVTYKNGIQPGMKRCNLIKKTFDKVFQSNIAVRYYLSFQCEEIQSC